MFFMLVTLRIFVILRQACSFLYDIDLWRWCRVQLKHNNNLQRDSMYKTITYLPHNCRQTFFQKSVFLSHFAKLFHKMTKIKWPIAESCTSGSIALVVSVTLRCKHSHPLIPCLKKKLAYIIRITYRRWYAL